MKHQTLFEQVKQIQKEVGTSVFEPRVFTVSEFYTYVNGLLGLEEVIVEGEVSEVKVAKEYLIYFSINDEQSVLPCLIYKNKLDANGLPVEAFEVGTTVQVRGFPNVYAKRGEFKLLAEKISLVGEGALKRAFELLKKKLDAQGLFRKDLKRPIPQYPEVIGLITSKGAAAYTDFLKVLRARWGGVRVYFYHTSVQGETAVGEILEAFTYFNTTLPYLDALILTRGGGSLEDLAPFNTELLARAVRSSKWPVICAIGHERDESLAELAADLRASTPSNAAELLVPTREEERYYFESLKKKFILHLEGKVSEEKQFFERVISLMDNFFQKPKTELLSLKEHLERAVLMWTSHIKSELSQKGRLLESFNPQAVLKRGYSITATEEGRIINSIKHVTLKQKVKTSVYDGIFTSSVAEILNPKS